MSDAAPDNSTFAQRARARGALKQVTAGQARNKAVTMAGAGDERLNNPEAEKDSEPVAPTPPPKTRSHK